MYENKDIIDATATGNGGTALEATTYWSSTEFGHNAAIEVDLSNGMGLPNNKGNDAMVRAVRTF